MGEKVEFQTSMQLLSDGGEGPDDLFRITIRTINPDQTGFMSHTEVHRADLPVFWLGANAIARAWEPAGLLSAVAET